MKQVVWNGVYKFNKGAALLYLVEFVFFWLEGPRKMVSAFVQLRYIHRGTTERIFFLEYDSSVNTVTAT